LQDVIAVEFVKLYFLQASEVDDVERESREVGGVGVARVVEKKLVD